MKPTLIEHSNMTCKTLSTYNNENYDNKRISVNSDPSETRLFKNFMTRIKARREFFENYEKRMLKGADNLVKEKESNDPCQDKDDDTKKKTDRSPNNNHNGKVENNAIVNILHDISTNLTIGEIPNCTRQLSFESDNVESCQKDNLTKEKDEILGYENRLFWEEDGYHDESCLPISKSKERLYDRHHCDSLKDVINCINEKIWPSRTNLNALPLANGVLADYNLDSTNMSLIYSLTPSNDISSENDDDYSVDVNDETFNVSETYQVDKSNESMNSTGNINQNPSTDNVHDESINSMDDRNDSNDNSSNDGSDILELPTRTVLELKDTLGVFFNKDMNSSVNQIIAELDANQVFIEAANIVDDVLEDATRLTSNLNTISDKKMTECSKLMVVNELVHHVIDSQDMDSINASTPRNDQERQCLFKTEILKGSTEVQHAIDDITNNDITTLRDRKCLENCTSKTFLTNGYKFDNSLNDMINNVENIVNDIDEKRNIQVLPDDQKNNSPWNEVVLEFCSIAQSSDDAIKLNFQIEKSSISENSDSIKEISKVSRKRKRKCEIECCGEKKSWKSELNTPEATNTKQYRASNECVSINNESTITNGNIDSEDHIDHCTELHNHHYHELSPIIEETITNEDSLLETTRLEYCDDSSLETKQITTSLVGSDSMNVSAEGSYKSTDYYTCKDDSSQCETSGKSSPDSNQFNNRDTSDVASISSDATYVICNDFTSPLDSPVLYEQECEENNLKKIKHGENFTSKSTLFSNNGTEELANLNEEAEFPKNTIYFPIDSLIKPRMLPRYEDTTLYRLVSEIRLTDSITDDRPLVFKH